ncbi:hypothetical protein OBBRIDRAFT_804664 [Obba rivulosa]|uniref:Uncharacterized protein n=1 Tax=Obba rivulosa TaxID=1052685 RepID=A0A8E2AWD0_9APHY|nr:hypothetical protein OBBRIDRAFT_804664 [Obba rivulosa]
MLLYGADNHTCGSSLGDLPPEYRNIRSFLDLLKLDLPQLPLNYTDNVLGATKKLSSAESSLDEDKQLRRIVFVPNLVDQLYGEASRLLGAELLDWNSSDDGSFAAAIHPLITTNGLPKIICSEKDTEAYSGAGILRPALTIINAIKTGTRKLGINNDTSMSSAPQDDVNPDALVLTRIRYRTAFFRYKRPRTSEEESITLFTELQVVHNGLKTNIGRALKFGWPDKSVIWAMKQLRCRRGCCLRLGCKWYSTTSRREFSPLAPVTTSFGLCPILAAFAWIAPADGLIDKKHLRLPPLDDWWERDASCMKRIAAIEVAGVYVW